ncbi:MAG: tetratricopeptide repeat protein [Planctomycetota bacterium]
MSARRIAVALAALAALLPGTPAAAQQPVESAAPNLREQAAGAENAGRFDEAADHWLALVAQEPRRAEWVLAAARCLGRSGRFNDAIDLLAQKRAAFPDLLDLPTLLARTHLLRVERDPGALNPELDYHDAIDLCAEILQRDANHEEARLIQAQAYYALGDAEAALEAAEAAVTRHPDRAGAHILVARIAFDRFRMLKARFDLEQPDEPQRGELVDAIDRERRRAIARFTQAAELDPERTHARVMLGDIAARDRDADAAVGHWRQALAIDPGARVDHAWITAQLEPSARREFYRQARLAYEQRPQASAAQAALLRFYEALALYAAQQWQPAQDLFATALRDNPEYRNAAYYGALCAWRLGDEDAAEELAARFAAASAPGFADVLRALGPAERSEVAGIVRYLGDRAYQNGRGDHSRDLNHVIACLLDSADAWNNYAFLCRETGRHEAAFAGYQHAIEREPESPQLWNDAAVVLQHHLPTPENLQRARQMYEHALELAQRVLDGDAATAIERKRAEKAAADVKANLAELPK